MKDIYRIKDLKAIEEEMKYEVGIMVNTLEQYKDKYLQCIMEVCKVDKSSAWVILNQRINDLISETSFKGVISMVGSNIIIDEPILEYEALEAYMKQFKGGE